MAEVVRRLSLWQRPLLLSVSTYEALRTYSQLLRALSRSPETQVARMGSPSSEKVRTSSLCKLHLFSKVRVSDLWLGSGLIPHAVSLSLVKMYVSIYLSKCVYIHIYIYI